MATGNAFWVADRLWSLPLITICVVFGAVALLATVLHGQQAGLRALACWPLGALPDYRSGMLYSLGTMTTYSHTDMRLEVQWRMMDALASWCDMLLFGLTTAFLFTAIQKKLWPLEAGNRRSGSRVEPSRSKS